MKDDNNMIESEIFNKILLVRNTQKDSKSMIENNDNNSID